MPNRTSYYLENANEGERLEVQASTENHNFLMEFKEVNLKLHDQDQILDAGCGTCTLGRALISYAKDKNIHITGVDLSKERLDVAHRENKKINLQNMFTLEQKSLHDINYNQNFDKIFCHYVLQHFGNNNLEIQKTINNLYLALKQNGELFLTDSYGFMSHLDTGNDWLLEQIKFIESLSPIDLNIGIKLRRFAMNAKIDIKNISIHVIPYKVFTVLERETEAALWSERLLHAKPLLIHLIGKKNAQRFTIEYVNTILDENSLILPRKIITKIKKL